MNDLTFLFNTCDKHSESWQPFFDLLKKMWPDFDLPVVLNTETKSFEFDGLDITAANFPKTKSWSHRLRKVLNTIDSEFVVVFLEDFFLESPVNLREFERCLEFIRNNKKVGCVSFRNTPDGVDESEALKNYALLKKKDRYIVNCQVAVWRTKVLKKLLRNHESAWEFERWGSWRARFVGCDIYSVLKGAEIPFDYDWGTPIYRGHWNLESLKRIEEKTGYAVKTETLPVIENMKALRQERRPSSFFSKFKRIRSLF